MAAEQVAPRIFHDELIPDISAKKLVAAFVQRHVDDACTRHPRLPRCANRSRVHPQATIRPSLMQTARAAASKSMIPQDILTGKVVAGDDLCLRHPRLVQCSRRNFSRPRIVSLRYSGASASFCAEIAGTSEDRSKLAAGRVDAPNCQSQGASAQGGGLRAAIATLWDGSAEYECALPLWCRSAERLADVLNNASLVLVALPNSSLADCPRARIHWPNMTALAAASFLSRQALSKESSRLRHTLLKLGAMGSPPDPQH